MGRTAYEAISASMTTATDHPFAPILTAGRKVVFSLTLKTADWANTPSPPVTRQERSTTRLAMVTATSWLQGAASGGVVRVARPDRRAQPSLFPYVAGEGTRLFDGVPKSYRLDLVSSTASSNGILELRYRRHR